MGPGAGDDRRVTNDPDRIQAEMAETRQALTDKLRALKRRLIGDDGPSNTQGRTNMAKTNARASKAGGTTKTRTAVKSKTAAKKSTARKAGASAVKAKPKAAGRSTAARGKSKLAGGSARNTAKPGKKKATTTARIKKTTRPKAAARKLLDKTTDVMGNVLAGAAIAAAQGAATVIAQEAGDAAATANQMDPATTAGKNTTQS